MKIWLRLVLSILLSVILSGAGLIYWATLEQRRIAVDQARDFANSVHQMTLAGLTGMMITGTVPLRPLFLDQIKEMNQIGLLRVIRGEAVVAQFGPGLEGETEADAAETAVLLTGEPAYAIRVGAAGNEHLRAIIPARAQENYLGKNCLNCHEVAPGAVLGVVSMEISLAQAGETVRQFSRQAMLAAALLCLPLALFIWFFVSRLVSRPLARMTDGLWQIAAGEIDESATLPVQRRDEVGAATLAFNRVMEKAGELIRQQRMAQLVFENSLEGITVTDADSRIQLVNKAFTDTTGYTAEEVVGRTPAILKSGRQGEEFYREFWQTLQATGEWRGEIWNRRKSGAVYAEWLNVSAVRNRRGQVEHYVAIFSDITERKEREELITHQAFHDALTGLPNRLLFLDRLEQALGHARRNRARTPAVMFLDLDRFKQINDTLGHDAGDQLLREVANRLRRCVRGADTVARLAGDEFTILLPEIGDEADARAVASKVLLAMREPVTLGGEQRVITTSIGISLFPRDGRDAETLMKHADTAMYQVKGSGRAGLCVFTETLLGKPSRRLEMETNLQRALERHEFALDYQPIIDLRSGAIHGHEARLCWHLPDGAVLPAEEFIGLAEEFGLMAGIAAWVLQAACHQAGVWRAAGLPATVAVNVSTSEFRRADWVESVRHTLQATGISPFLLEIEIEERLLMQDGELSRRVLGELAGLGVGATIDHFGSGYSNLALLRELPVQALKIDAALLRSAVRPGADGVMLAAVFGLAACLGLRTVADGIDDAAALALVRQLHADLGQGSLLTGAGSA